MPTPGGTSSHLSTTAPRRGGCSAASPAPATSPWPASPATTAGSSFTAVAARACQRRATPHYMGLLDGASIWGATRLASRRCSTQTARRSCSTSSSDGSRPSAAGSTGLGRAIHRDRVSRFLARRARAGRVVAGCAPASLVRLGAGATTARRSAATLRPRLRAVADVRAPDVPRRGGRGRRRRVRRRSRDGARRRRRLRPLARDARRARSRGHPRASRPSGRSTAFLIRSRAGPDRLAVRSTRRVRGGDDGTRHRPPSRTRPTAAPRSRRQLSQRASWPGPPRSCRSSRRARPTPRPSPAAHRWSPLRSLKLERSAAASPSFGKVLQLVHIPTHCIGQLRGPPVRHDRHWGRHVGPATPLQVPRLERISLEPSSSDALRNW